MRCGSVEVILSLSNPLCFKYSISVQLSPHRLPFLQNAGKQSHSITGRDNRIPLPNPNLLPLHFAADYVTGLLAMTLYANS